MTELKHVQMKESKDITEEDTMEEKKFLHS